MFKNIVVTSLRNFFRNRIFSLINLVGLSVSMSLSMLIIMIIRDQLSFDNFHSDADRIYRVNTILHHPEWGDVDLASTPLPIGSAMQEDYSFTENIVRLNRELVGDASYANVTVPVKGIVVDPSFLEIFNFPFLKGNSTTALVAPNSLVLTTQTAEKIFGATDPIGQTISIGRYGDFTITGVLDELPGKTHFEFEMLCSISTLPVLEKSGTLSPTLDNWSAYYNNYVYIKLKEGRTHTEVEQALNEINKKHGTGLKSEGKDISYSFYLHPLEKITPGPEISGQMGRGMPAFFLIFLAVLAGVVLLMSVFNFTNLTIAKSLTRTREIGIRKVVGANRNQVFLQFIGEAVVFSLVALVSSYLLLQFLKVGFLQLSLQEDFLMNLNEDTTLYAIFILFAIGVGLLAGVLPAAYLSAFKPSRVLKDVQSVKIYSGLTFRKMLMVSQFTLSVIFVIVVQVVYRQVDYMLNADYGIAQENNLNIALRGVPFETLATEVRGLPGVVRVGGVSNKLGTFEDSSSDYKKNKTDKPFNMREFAVDDNYIENLELVFVAGRNFNAQEQIGYEKHVILNETALTQFGFQDARDAVGQVIYADDTLVLQVVGLVKDFHFRPLTNKIGPLALRYNTKALGFLSANIIPSQKESTIEAITAIWKKHDPVHPVELMMMDEEIDEAYQESGMNDAIVIVGYITFLVISLACLGMLGMAMYATQVRVKEVGIRKVMGASVTDVVTLLSKSFMILIGIAILIGVPVSFLLGEGFLQEYPYRVEITPFLLGSSILIIAGLGFLIVWSQTIMVAATNPLKWLRNE